MNNEINHCPTPKGALLVIGGHEDKGEGPQSEGQKYHFTSEEVLRTFLQLTGKAKPVLEIITSASAEGKESFNDYAKVFSKNGVKEIRHIHHVKRSEVLNDPVIERLNEADAVFFAGGDQLLLTSLYGGTNFLKRLKERYIYEKFVVAGTSAGAMAMSTPMIYAGANEVQEITGEIKVTTGLEFLRDVCVDTHFVNRGRMVRLAQVIASNPTCIGLGIEEDTAVVVSDGLKLRDCGSGVVVIIDGHNLTQSNITDFTEKVPISIRGLQVHILAGGEEYELPQYNPPHV